MTNKITYTQQGDYLLPDLKLPEQPKVEIGIWGKRHLKYINLEVLLRLLSLTHRSQEAVLFCLLTCL
jgi:hypothetical protein